MGVYCDDFMRRALSLAARAWGCTHPNPMVGALVVDAGGKILAEGWHQAAGEPHAEVHALQHLLGSDLRNATLYVTLEPCSTTGRTPPCTDLILKSGIGRVVVGATDPNPAHAGRGLALLREAGVEVVHGVLERDCEDLNLLFNHWIRVHSPLIAGKIATTLDGRMATASGHSKWITGEAARADVHRWRRYFPAIGVGRGTVEADDPQLTSRVDGEPDHCGIRFVFSRSGNLADLVDRKVFTDAWREQTVVVCGPQAQVPSGLRSWRIDAPDEDSFWRKFRSHCASEHLIGVYVEGGAAVLSSLIRTGHLDYLFSYRAPKILADGTAPGAFGGRNPTTLDEALLLGDVRMGAVGMDQFMRGKLVYPGKETQHANHHTSYGQRS